VVLTTTTSTVWSQASVAVALPQTTGVGQSIVVLAGQVINGALLSVTVMVALQVAVLLQSSVALQTRVRILGQVPLGVVLTTTTSTVPSQASVAVALPQATATEQSIVVLAGQVIKGAVMSLTVTVARQVAVLPQSSVAFQVRVQIWGHVPVQLVLTTEIATLWSTSSEAVGSPQTTLAGQSIVVLAGQEIVGGVTSVLSKTSTESIVVQPPPTEAEM
jgi:RNase P/RNase MRP subunit p29